MTNYDAVPQPVDEPAIASAENGFVILDGHGIAVTLTAKAAAQTGRNLLDAAADAQLQLNK